MKKKKIVLIPTTLPSDEDVLTPLLEIVKATILSLGPGSPASSHAILTALMMRDGRTQSELGEAAGLPKYTVSRCLRSLEEHGLVNQARDDGNRREVIVTLTARGRQVRARLLDAARQGALRARQRGAEEARRQQLQNRD